MKNLKKLISTAGLIIAANIAHSAETASPQAYWVPTRYGPELRGDQQTIATSRRSVQGVEGELAMLQHAFNNDIEAAKASMQAAESEYQTETAPYTAKMAQITELVRARRQQLDNELATLPARAQDHPVEHNRKVYLRTAAVERYQADFNQAGSALAPLCQEVKARKLAYSTKVQVIRQAYDQASAARKATFDAKLSQYKSQVQVLNAIINAYNSKLERYGTPVNSPRPTSTADAPEQSGFIRWIQIQPNKPVETETAR